MAGRLSGKTAFITAAGQGMGRAAARLFYGGYAVKDGGVILGALLLLFIVERLWCGDPPKTSIMYRDDPEAME